MATESFAATEQPSLGRAPLLHHINLKTTRKEEMVAWYQRVLGMKVLHDHPAAAWLTNDAANHRVALVAMPGVEPDDRRTFHDGLHHTAFEVGSFDELNGTYLRLREAGIEPQFSMDHGITLSYYYADPDGNFIEVQVDVFGDWDKSSEFMANRLQEQEYLIGALVDPAKIADAAAAGASIEEIHEKAYAGGFAPDGPPPDLGMPPPPPDAPPILRV